MKILMVDDDVDILDITAYALRRGGYTVITAVDGHQALCRWQSDNPDLVILDVMLPKLDGFEICRRIRSESDVPVLMLSARVRDDDVVRGLDLGADDYIVKPFSHQQLLARVRTATRRAGIQRPAQQSALLTVGEITLDVDAHEVIRAGRRIFLTPIEFRLLHCLAANAGRLVSTEKLIEYVWGFKNGGDANLLRTHVCHIRRKIGLQPSRPGYIKNTPSVGYACLGQSVYEHAAQAALDRSHQCLQQPLAV